MTPPTTILVGRIGPVFWLRVEGRGTFQNSVQVKRVLQTVMARGSRHLVVDLERCPMMDSTFLGTLTFAALHLREAGNGSLSVLNANQRNQQLLVSLGLDHILDIDKEGTAWAEERKAACARLAMCDEKGAASPREQAQHVLQSHQTLANVSDDNESRFRDVIQFLEKELEGTPSPASSS